MAEHANTSPRWLISHDRKDEAIQVLACIEAKSVDDPYITTQHDEIKFSIQYEREEAVRWRDLLRGAKTDGTKALRRLLLGAGTQAMQQFQGAFLYPSTLLRSSSPTINTILQESTS